MICFMQPFLAQQGTMPTYRRQNPIRRSLKRYYFMKYAPNMRLLGLEMHHSEQALSRVRSLSYVALIY
jgi:hypothetical protein